MHLDFTGATTEFSHFHVCVEKDSAAQLITAQRQPRLRCHKSKSNPLVLPPLLRANLRQEVSGSIVPSIGPNSKAFFLFLRELWKVAPCVQMRKKKEKEREKERRPHGERRGSGFIFRMALDFLFLERRAEL